ncbi:hypothetical protein GCM10023100_35540 [Actinocorallia cavernae]|uniref:Uncharacterized protein n=2 Tax=Actinomycetes TaxID=1760 RepID=A0ABP6A9W6_9ACTN
MGESVIAAAMLRMDFLPETARSPVRYAAAQRRWSARGRCAKS